MEIKNFVQCIWTSATLMLGASCLTMSTGALQATQAPQAKTLFPNVPDSFCSVMIDKVRACVDYNKDITCKDQIHALLSQLEMSTFVSQEGQDDFRAQFIHAQGCFEHVLSCSQVLGEITQLVGVIHTPMPATPLCTNLNDPLLGQLLDASIAQDEDKLLTVRSRSQIVRDYVDKGGKLFITYPIGGLEKRTTDQQQYYLDALNQYPQSLIDCILTCDQMDPEMIGATYAFKNNDKWYAFSIKARQAADPQANSEWAIWFGRIGQPLITARLIAVHKFLISNGGPDLRGAILAK